MDKGYLEGIARMAKLELDDDLMKKFKERIDMFSDYAEQLAEINTDDIAPLVNVNESISELRDDELEPSLPRDLVLENAPEKMYGCIKVDKIIE